MTIQVLKIISEDMTDNGINYELGSWTGDIVYPYFVGEYQEIPITSESGMQETTFLLTGFTRGSLLELEEAKEKIKKVYNKVHGKRAIAETGDAVAIFYETSLNIPTGDAELKKIQITLSIKEWSVS